VTSTARKILITFFCSGEVFCDIKLETDDHKIITAHKVVLSAASPYFHAIFTKFAEKNQDIVAIRKVDYTALQLLVNFIYSGKILITQENVKVIIDKVRFNFGKQNYFNCILFISQGIVISCKSLAVTRS